MTIQQMREVQILRYITEAATENPMTDLSREELVSRVCQYGRRLEIRPAEVGDVLNRSVQTIVLKGEHWS